MEKNEEEPLINNDIIEETKPKGKNKKKSKNKLNAVEIKKEQRKKDSNILNFSSSEEDKNYRNNKTKFLLIIAIISSFFLFKQKLIYLKHNYLSDNSLFPLNIFYSKPKYNFLLFIILICCFTISTGFKLLILQFLSYSLIFVIIITKNKITKSRNIFEKNLVVFNCSEIIISFLYLGEKLIQIYEDNSLNIAIIVIILFFNYNLILYFICVEIINCKYDDIITDIIWSLLSTMILYFSVFYIMKLSIWPKQIIAIILRHMLKTFFICLTVLALSFVVFYYYDCLEYFFANKILMKIVGFLSYLIFELYFVFRDKKEKKLKIFNSYNIYSNQYLYSKTSKIKLFIRVIIISLLEYFLLYKLDISYESNIEISKCFLIILMDILHGFLVMFTIKYIFNWIYLNNTDLIELNTNSPFMRFGSLSNLNNDGIPSLIFE